MKNYIANENGGWMTSTIYIRQSLLKAIQIRRSARNDADIYEALRLLGQALHTLEDLPAHSNWVELALIEMGYSAVFAHVGSNTAIHLGGKRIWPLITGTFGGMDFIHSLLGEATDHLSQTQISDVNSAVTNASAQGGNSAFTALQNLFAHLPGHQARELSQECEGIQENSSRMAVRSRAPNTAAMRSSQTGDFDPEKIAQEIYPILLFRDKVVKAISLTLEKVSKSPPRPPLRVPPFTNLFVPFFLSSVYGMLKWRVDTWIDAACGQDSSRTYDLGVEFT